MNLLETGDPGVFEVEIPHTTLEGTFHADEEPLPPAGAGR